MAVDNVLGKLERVIDIIMVLIEKDLKVRYKSTVFGYLWSVGHPLAFAAVFFIAFRIVMRVDVEDYILFLISGLFPWQWFSNSLQAAPMVFLSNAAIIKKMSFPRNMLPFAVVLQDMIHYVLSFPVIVLFLFFYGKHPYLSWLYGVPMLLTVQFLITYAFCLVIASLNLFFRDLERLTSIALTLVFYFTPIIYPETMVPARFQGLLALNPLAPLVISWRHLLMYGTLEAGYVAISLGYSLVFMGFSYLIYRKLSWRFAEVL